MKFPKAVKAAPGFYFWIKSILLHINWAKTWTWVEQNFNRTKQNTYYFSIHLMQKPVLKNKKIAALSALCVIIGPLKIVIGVADEK